MGAGHKKKYPQKRQQRKGKGGWGSGRGSWKKSQEAALKFMRPWRAILPVCESFSNKIPFCGHRNWLCRCGRAAAPAATTQPARTPHTLSLLLCSTPLREMEGGCCGPVGLIKSRFTLILIHAKPFLPFVFSLIYAANTERERERELGGEGFRGRGQSRCRSWNQLQLGRSIERFRRVVPRKFSLEW